jgi:hypothetical protein
VGKGCLYREVRDHMIILNERHLRRVLQSYLRYYRRWRTHLSLMTDCPHSRLTQLLGGGGALPCLGSVGSIIIMIMTVALHYDMCPIKDATSVGSCGDHTHML